MKKILISIFLLLAVLNHPKAQINVYITSQPLWGPVGYDRADYYYLPDIETYYYVPQRQFIYQDNGQWVFSNSLPAKYRNYDLYNGYKVVLNQPKPYLLFNEHKVKYARYKNIHTQPVIIKSEDPKYFVIKGHPKNGVPPGQAKKLVSKPKGHEKGKKNK
jgi:hypothetical protein